MAADLHIHVYGEGDLSNDDFRCFFGNTLGSRWFSMGSRCEKWDCEHSRRIYATDSVWVGEVSWLKAALLEDPDTFIPDVVDVVNNIIGEDSPIIDDEFIKRLAKSFSAPNKTSYSVSDGREILEFLEKHKGKRAFTVSW